MRDNKPSRGLTGIEIVLSLLVLTVAASIYAYTTQPQFKELFTITTEHTGVDSPTPIATDSQPTPTKESEQSMTSGDTGSLTLGSPWYIKLLYPSNWKIKNAVHSSVTNGQNVQTNTLYIDPEDRDNFDEIPSVFLFEMLNKTNVQYHTQQYYTEHSSTQYQPTPPGKNSYCYRPQSFAESSVVIECVYESLTLIRLNDVRYENEFKQMLLSIEPQEH